MDNSQNPFIPPWGFPWQLLTQPSQQSPNQPPTRVRIALSLLQSFTDKTSTRIVGGACDIAVDILEFPGQKLTDEERMVQIGACKLLSDYLKGTLELDVWEENQEVLRMAPLRTNLQYLSKPTFLNCPFCHNQGPDTQQACGLCKGSGSILVYSTRDLKNPNKEE